MKIRLREISVVALNTRTVILLTRFVRVARVREGADIKMQQPDVVRRVFNYASRTNNVELLILFKKLKKEMIQHIFHENFENPSFQIYESDGKELRAATAA